MEHFLPEPTKCFLSKMERNVGALGYWSEKTSLPFALSMIFFFFLGPTKHIWWKHKSIISFHISILPIKYRLKVDIINSWRPNWALPESHISNLTNKQIKKKTIVKAINCYDYLFYFYSKDLCLLEKRLHYRDSIVLT